MPVVVTDSNGDTSAIESIVFNNGTDEHILYQEPIVEVSGSLPLAFTGARQRALDNYTVHGTAEGAGEQTENLWDNVEFFEKTDLATDSIWKWTASNVGGVFRVPCEGSTQYTIKVYADMNGFYRLSTKKDSLSPSQEASQRAVVDIIKTSNISQYTFTTPADAQFILFQVQSTYVDITNQQTCLVKGSTAPASYIPYGYKIPLTVTSGQNTDTHPLYIGDTKLGEEEYVDYEGQKVYKRTENMFNKDAKNANNGYVDGEYLSGTNSTTASSSYAISEYLPVLPNTQYYLKNAATSSDQYRRMVFYNSSKTGLSNLRYRDTGSPNDFSFTTPENCAYIRISFIINNAANISLTLSPVSEYIPYLQPTDPPSPLPAITAYAGENTLSSTETVGEVTVKGRLVDTTN